MSAVGTPFPRTLLAATLLAVGFLTRAALGADGDATLARKARALLSDRCFACHGPDEAKRQAGLRLDERESFVEAAGVVTPGDVDASELVRRITADNDAARMPPPASNLSLTGEEVAFLTRWVEAGAPWTDHWAFVPPVAEAPPRAPFPEWGANAIDRFVAAQLVEHNLRPAGEADREQLIRRVTLDLTGVPPTLEEIDAFVNDASPDAYERLVDRLLASPRFGERMAVDWLDAARYADTYGYQNDRYSAVWPWRDWVIRAVNENLPYDEFLTRQIAGDLLPEAGDDAVLATAFNRLHRLTNEGGSIPAEFRAEAVADRTNTLGAAVMGLTVECARCHDHKFDPISQRDYYQLFAYFNNIEELGLYSHYTDAIPTPTLWLESDQQRARLDELAEQIREAETKLEQLKVARRDSFEEWITDKRGRLEEYTGLPFPMLRRQLDGTDPEGTYVEQSPLPDGQPHPPSELPALDGETGFKLRIDNKLTRDDAFTVALWVKPTERAERAVLVHHSAAWLDAAGRGYQLILEDGRPSAALVHFWPGDAIAVRAVDPLPIGEWSHVAMTYDGASRAAGLRIVVNGAEVATKTVKDSLTRTINYVEGDLVQDKGLALLVGYRFRDTGFAGGRVADVAVFNTELSGPQMRRLATDRSKRPAGPRGAPSDASLYEHYLRFYDEPYRAAQRRLKSLRRDRSNLVREIDEIMVMREMPGRRATHVLQRGAYDSPGEAVAPATPAKIASGIAPDRRDRLGLARWITHPQNPLTARVAVNRFWQALFGAGIVATPNDFGSQGAAPSHPRLLDWLARRLVNSGWDVKQLVKTIVMSATYRQSSVATPEKLAADPENVWLSRAPSHRLPAEMIRDSALAASGLLVEQLGGPPVKPFQPPGLWEEKGAATYERDVGAGSHRRSVYTFWKRTSPHPVLTTFDASDREVCVMQRQTTATPLQALVTLNDPQFLEAARGVADRSWQEAGGAVQSTIERAFRRLTSRRPDERECRVLLQLYEDQLTTYEHDRAAAEALLAIGDHEPACDASPPQLAAMSMVALAVMNHDAAVMKR